MSDIETVGSTFTIKPRPRVRQVRHITQPELLAATSRPERRTVFDNGGALAQVNRAAAGA